MTHEEPSFAFFSKVVAREASPIEHEEHPDLDLLFASLEGDIAAEQQSSLSAHLATCEACRARWRKLAASVVQAAEAQKIRSRVPSFDAYVRERIAPRTAWVDRLRSMLEVRTLAVAAASMVALVVVVIVTIPLVRAPAVRTSLQLETLDERLATLQNRLDLLVRYPGQGTNQVPFTSGILASDLAGFDWGTLLPYTVRTGDTWEGIAERQVGDADLWPLLWLLNREVSAPDASPPLGASVMLPAPRADP